MRLVNRFTKGFTQPAAPTWTQTPHPGGSSRPKCAFSAPDLAVRADRFSDDL